MEGVAALEALGRAALPRAPGGDLPRRPGAGRSPARAGGGRARRWWRRARRRSCPGHPIADVFLEIEGEAVFAGTPAREPSVESTLGGEPWGRVELSSRRARSHGAERGSSLHRLMLAAQLAARAIGSSSTPPSTRGAQASSGAPSASSRRWRIPLADAPHALAAAAGLARAAACHFDAGAAARRATSRRPRTPAACEAALEAAAYVCHQVFGAIGHHARGPGLPRLAPHPAARRPSPPVRPCPGRGARGCGLRRAVRRTSDRMSRQGVVDLPGRSRVCATNARTTSPPSPSIARARQLAHAAHAAVFRAIWREVRDDPGSAWP